MHLMHQRGGLRRALVNTKSNAMRLMQVVKAMWLYCGALDLCDHRSFLHPRAVSDITSEFQLYCSDNDRVCAVCLGRLVNFCPPLVCWPSPQHLLLRCCQGECRPAAVDPTCCKRIAHGPSGVWHAGLHGCFKGVLPDTIAMKA